MEMEHVLHWLWLTSKFNGANRKIAKLTEFFGSVDEVYASRTFHNLKLTDEEKRLLCDKDLSHAEKICEEVARIGGKIIAVDDPNYPKLLKQTHTPPTVLYIKGMVPSLDDVLTIGVVGTRNMSVYGRIVTERLCANLAKAGAVTVSGMAAGIDAVGAWATIEEGGIAVGVIGCGIDMVYPTENAELYKAIAERGCIMTEFPPGTPPIAKNFPIRNRIIAGLSRGVLVTEAPPKSGALITARYAMDEGRDVFAVPRNISDVKYLGTNMLIQQGAKLINHPNDILCEYPYAKKIEVKEVPAKEKKEHHHPPAAAVKPTKAKKDTDDKINEKIKALAGTERTIAEMLAERGMQIDEISRAADMPVSELNTLLIMLEMKGVIERLPGSAYRIKN